MLRQSSERGSMACPRLVTARGAESARAAFALFERFDFDEFGLHDGNDDELREAFEGFDRLRFLTAVPAGDHEFALVVAVDEADEVAEDEAFFVPEPRARKNEGGIGGIRHVNGDPGVNKRRFTRRQREGFIEQGAQIESGRTRRGVAGKVFADAFVKNAVGELHGIQKGKGLGRNRRERRSQRSSSGPYSSSRRSTA